MEVKKEADTDDLDKLIPTAKLVRNIEKLSSADKEKRIIVLFAAGAICPIHRYAPLKNQIVKRVLQPGHKP